MRMNRGTGVMVNVVRELKIPRVMFFNPAEPMNTIIPIMFIKRKENATGNFVRRRIINPPRKKMRTIHHSIRFNSPWKVSPQQSYWRFQHFLFP